MVTLLGGLLITLGVLAVTSVFAVFVGYLVVERGDVALAAQKTMRRAGGVLMGAASFAAAALTLGVDVAMQVPELIITVLGIGSILAGVSWPMFGATAFTVWALAEGYSGGPR